jgi:signal transduction histidine kinase
MDEQTKGLPRVAIAIAVVAWGIALLSIVLTAAARPKADVGFWFFAVDAMVAIVYGTTAAITLSRRQHPVPWVLAVTAIGGGLAALGYAWMVFQDVQPRYPEFPVLVQFQNTAWVPGTLALFLVIPWFIRDHPLRWEWLGVAAGVGVIGFAEWERYAREGAFDLHLFAATVILGVCTAVAVELRRRFGPVDERNGLGWLALGTLVMALSFIPLVLMFFLPDAFWIINFTPALHVVAQALFPAAILVAVLRGRMWGLDLAISRAILVGLMTAVLLSGYLVVSVLASAVLPGRGFAPLLAAAAVAVGVQPALLWAGRRVRRLVYGEAAADPTRIVLGLGSKLGVAGDLDDLFSGLARDLGTGLRLESVTVRADGLGDVHWGSPTSAPTVVPLLHRGETVGAVEVTAPAGESLGPSGERLIADFGAVAAAALAVRAQAREVDEARRRLTRARLEERRVIRREIHDELGPSLAGLRLGLQGARNLLGRDDEAVARILEELQNDLDQRVTQVRTLSHSLLPPVLDELGLGPALEELGVRHAESGLPVTVDATVPADLPKPVAAAAYAIAGEALTNAARHSGTTQCWLNATVADGRLTLTIDDAGRGIASDAVPGVGSQSMRERAEELGGRLIVEPRSGGGTSVRAQLPWEEIHD